VHLTQQAKQEPPRPQLKLHHGKKT
jgi:hypothetical protein